MPGTETTTTPKTEYLLLKAARTLKPEGNEGMGYSHVRSYHAETLEAATEAAACDFATLDGVRRLTVGYNHQDPAQADCVMFPAQNMILLAYANVRFPLFV